MNAVSLAATPNPAPVETAIDLTVSVLSDRADSGLSVQYRLDEGEWLLTTLTDGISPAEFTANLGSFPKPVVHEVCARMLDGSEPISPPECILLAVYDPSAGFVTGAGWIESPPGSYVADPERVGRVTFGFVAPYQRGAQPPTDSSFLEFRVAHVDFHATGYDSLVIAGARAQFRGSGVINGGGDYRFMLTAIDGERPGGRGMDSLRIKIVDKATDQVVYDNQRGKDEAGDDATALGGGSIIIQEARGGGRMAEDTSASPPDVLEPTPAPEPAELKWQRWFPVASSASALAEGSAAAPSTEFPDASEGD